MNGMISRRRPLALFGGLASMVLAGQALAAPAPPFAQLVKQAEASPRLEVLDADVDRARGLSEQAGARPNPNISVYAENFAGSTPYRAFDRTETTVQYNQPIELGGKRSARIAAGEAGVAAAVARGREGRLAFVHQLALAYAAVEISDRRIEIARDEVEESESVLKLARALVDAGKETRLRAVQAETELNAARAVLEGAGALRIAALARLSALCGVDTPFTGVSESLLDRLAASGAYGPVDPAQTAGYVTALAEREAAERHVVSERRRAIPDVTGQIGVRRLDGDKATALVAGISVPLNIFDRNKGNIAAAEAALRGAEARAAAARMDAEANVRSAAALVQASDAQATAASRTMDTAEESYRLARIAYEAGKAPLSELLMARHGLGVARGIVVDAAAARLEAHAQLASLQGLAVTGEPVQ